MTALGHFPGRWPSMVVAALVGLGSSGAACSSQKGPGGAPGGDDAGSDGGATPDDGGGDGATDEDAPPTQAFLRIAHVSPDLPAVDVCVAAHGSGSFQGPLLAPLASGGAGLAYAEVSAYLPLEPGTYDVRLVAAGATSCASLAVEAGALPDATNLPALAAGASATLLVAGEVVPVGSDPGITFACLPDDATLAGGGASLRAVNAMPGEPSLDFGFESSPANWMPLLTGVSFAAASAKANPDDDGVDANGYVPIAPLDAQAVSARPSASDAGIDLAAASSVTIPLGSIATVIAIGRPSGDAAHPPALLLCTDNQPSGGLLADCSIAQ